MSKAHTYKDYAAHIEFAAEDRIFFGRIAGIADIVTFHGETVVGLIHAFEEAVDEYLAMSDKLSRDPQKPFSGRLMLRISPDVHAHAALMAKSHGKSINQWAAEVLSLAN